MRIVLLSWARIWESLSLGGGSNGYASAIALELARRGHDVIYLCGGTTYENSPDGSAGPCRLLRHADWQRIRVFEVVNSPVLAPGFFQIGDPLAEVSSPELERLVGALFSQLQPDVLHIHNIEGFSIGCVDAAAATSSRPRIVFSLHTYHPVCPQACLMQGHRRPCLSFDNGHSCASCIPALDPADARRLRAAEAKQQPELAIDPTDPCDVLGPLPPVEPDGRWRVADAKTDPRRRMPSGHETGEHTWIPLENLALGEPASSKAPNDYAVRRDAMVAMLNRCDRVLAVSRFVRDKFQALGLDLGVTSTLYIGSRMPELAASRSAAPRPSPVTDPAAPLRVAFLGFNVWHKGPPLLAAALSLLDAGTLSRIHLSLFAGGGHGLREMFAPFEPMLAGLTLQNAYEYDEVPILLDGIDLGLVTSVWWDNAPQTVMEFNACGIPVLGAELGGIPDFIRHGHNGFLFRGNDPPALAAELGRLAREPWLVAAARANVLPPKGIPEHVLELEEVYAGRLRDDDVPPHLRAGVAAPR